MDSVIRQLVRLVERAGKEVSRFDETTWCILAAVTVLFGYYLLRGQPR
ncbi:MAG: hypothetical protein VYE64_04380 [Planctomycetota bacterium]|nr:hypothetical protein [Planctomycetota bacterium]